MLIPGSVAKMDGDQFKVNGVARMSRNSHFQFNCLISFSTWSSKNKGLRRGHGLEWLSHLRFAARQQAAAKVRHGMAGFITRNVEKGGMYYEDLPLQALPRFTGDTTVVGKRQTGQCQQHLYLVRHSGVYSCDRSFNYVTFHGACSRRLKEVGLRKVLGDNAGLIAQFLGDRLSLAWFRPSWVLCWPGCAARIQQVLETSLSFSILPSPLYSRRRGTARLFLGLISGAYPALVISGFQPLQIFRPAASACSVISV